MRVLGIDPGSRVTGFAVIESNGPDIRHVQSGTIRLSAADLGMRLGQIHQRLVQVIAETRP